MNIKNASIGLPWWSGGEELPCSAGDIGSTPGLGRSRMPQGNSAHGPQCWPSRSTTEAGAPGDRAPQQEKPQLEACTRDWRGRPCSPQLERPHTQQRRPSTAKSKNQPINLKRMLMLIENEKV